MPIGLLFSPGSLLITMNVCVRACTSVYTHSYYTHMRAHTYVGACVRTHTRVLTHVRACARAHTHTPTLFNLPQSLNSIS